MPKDISVATQRFTEGVSAGGAADKWARHSQSSAGDYGTSFGPYLTAQNGCAAEVKHKGQGGFDALVAYAGCMRGKFRGGA